MNTLRDTLQTGRSKYRSVKTEYGGRMYASKKEAARAETLDWLLKIGEALEWYPQIAFACVVKGQKICTYIADFKVVWKDGRTTYEDVKGMRTPVYRLKKKLVEALYSIQIEEK